MGMQRNINNWKLVLENNNIESIKKTNTKLKEDGKDNGMKLRKESITKSYKYIGDYIEYNNDIVVFSSDVYKDYSQKQISLF